MSKMVKPYPGMVIDQDVTFYPGVYDFFMESGFVVTGDNITIDANHAVFINGSREEKMNEDTVMEEFGYGGQKTDVAYRGYYGIAITSTGTKNVILKNMHAKGFLMGCRIESCEGWSIEHCDFSYNYHNMDWGWDDHPIRGGIHLIHSHDCMIAHNKVTDVWDALVLTHSNRNKVLSNNLSHTSDTGLKLWHACENEIRDNDISWGLRKSPGEVHARDSAGVLVESGSNNNMFKGNDMTYGGDGFFIRSLNGWMSTGNVIVENDMSFANNNAIEAWSDHNTYIKNKVNHSSYGFWLGNSDHTVLIGNEVAYNGGNFHNAPEAFGNSGIAVVNGSGSHMIMKENHVHDNVGPGLAIRFNRDYPSYHWIIENNTFENNKTQGTYKGHGIYLKNAKWITLGGNTFLDNEGEDIYTDGYVADIQYLKGGLQESPEAVLRVSNPYFVVGETYTFDASQSTIHNQGNRRIRWDFGDGSISHEETIEKVYNQPGLYRVGLTVDDGERAGMDYMNVYVTPSSKGLEDYERWSLNSHGEDSQMWHEEVLRVTSTGAVGVKATHGTAHVLNYRLEKSDCKNLEEASHLTFMLKFHGESTDWEDESMKPVITITDDNGKVCRYTPTFAHLRLYNAYINEYKDNWMYFAIPLGGNEVWVRQVDEGFNIGTGEHIAFDIGPHASSYCEFYLDGVKATTIEDNNWENILVKKEGATYPAVTTTSSHERSDDMGPLRIEDSFGDGKSRFITANGATKGMYQIDLGTERYMDTLRLSFCENQTGTEGACGESLPKSFNVYGKVAHEWIQLGTYSKVASRHELTFEPIRISGIRCEIFGTGMPMSIEGIEGYNRHNRFQYEQVEITSSNATTLVAHQLGLRVNKEINESGSALGDLIVGINSYKEASYEGLYKMIIPREQVDTQKELIVSLPMMGLASDTTYFVTLGQTNEAESRSIGSYYRWVAGGFTQNDPTYGFILDESFHNDPIGWGKNWMKVYTNRGVYDYTTMNENLGNRLGIKEQPLRFQNFEMEDPTQKVCTPSLDQRLGWMILRNRVETLTLKTRDPLEGGKLVLYFDQGGQGKVTVSVNGAHEQKWDIAPTVEWEIQEPINQVVITIESTEKNICLNNVEWM